jgi:WD40 repeat protein
MQKIIHLLLLLLSGQIAYCCTLSREFKTKMAVSASINSSNHQTDSAVATNLDDPASLDKQIYVNYTGEKSDPVAFPAQAINHCKLLKAQKSLDKQAGIYGNPLLLTRELFPGILLEDISTYLTLIVQSNGNTNTAEKSLLSHLEAESPDKVIKLCNAAIYMGIKPLINASILFIKKYAIKNLADKKLFTLLKSLNPEIQKLITPSMIYAHTPSYEFIANNSYTSIAPQKINSSKVISVNWSPDGTKLVSGLDSGTVLIWDAHTGALIDKPLIGHTNRVTSVSWSPDGTRLASSSWDNSIRIWNAITGALIDKPLTDFPHYVNSVKWSPDSTKLASCSDDRTIRIWNAITSAPIGEPLRGHVSAVTSISWSPDNAHLASCSIDQTIRIWNAETGIQIGEPFTGHTNWVTSVSWSPDGTKLASSSYDRTIRLWNAQTGAPIGEPFTGHTNWVTSVSWSPDGTKLASSSDDKTVLLWDAKTGAPVGAPLTGHTNYVTSISWSPDSTRLASSSHGTICIWNVKTASQIVRLLVEHATWVTSVTWSPDGTRLASSTLYQNIGIWNLKRFYETEKKCCSLTIEQVELLFDITSNSSLTELNHEQQKVFNNFPPDLLAILFSKIKEHKERALIRKQPQKTWIERAAMATTVVALGVSAYQYLL